MAKDDHVVTRGSTLLVVSIILLAVANLVSVFRLGARAIKKQLGADDYVLGLATISLDIQLAFVFCSIAYGFGKHGADLTRENHLDALKYFYLVQIMYKIVGGFTKAAFVLLYLRIFPEPHFRWFAKWIVLSAITLSTIAFTFATIFQCQPIPLAWNKSLHGTCFNNTAFWYAHAAIHTSLDLIIFSMPIPMVWKLHMPVQKRVGLIALFILGFFGCIASVIRMVALNGSSKSHDPTWGSYNALMWTVVEANISIICACLPPLRGPATTAFRRARGKEPNTTSSYSYRMKELSSSRKKQRSILGSAEIGIWHSQGVKSGYDIQVKESATRSGSEDSIVPRAFPGITKTTQWEVMASDTSQAEDMLQPESVPHRV